MLLAIFLDAESHYFYASGADGGGGGGGGGGPDPPFLTRPSFANF